MKLASGTTARAVEEWIGKTPNSKIPEEVGIRIFMRYGGKDGKTGQRLVPGCFQFDHITADALKRTRIQSIEEGLHVCGVHHKVKTHNHDRPKIRKAKRIDESRAGIKPRFSRPMPGSKASGWKKLMSGEVVRR